MRKSLTWKILLVIEYRISKLRPLSTSSSSPKYLSKAQKAEADAKSTIQSLQERSIQLEEEEKTGSLELQPTLMHSRAMRIKSP